jgi:ubiquinone/menaquinone biosynthesis C-methylase UbiE
VLILGEGDGRFVARLAAHYPDITIDVFDTSREMLRLARQRIHTAGISPSSSIAFHHEDARTASFPDSAYDLVVTHFFFDVFSAAELSPLIHRVAQALRPNGIWLISEFDLPEGGARRLFARFWIRVMYLFFRCATGLRNQRLPDWRQQLTAAGFHPRTQQHLANGFLASELWERVPEHSAASTRRDEVSEMR